jgi:hypothetical protein
MAVSETKQNIFQCTNKQFIGGLTTAQGVDPFPKYRYFSVLGVNV